MSCIQRHSVNVGREKKAIASLQYLDLLSWFAFPFLWCRFDLWFFYPDTQLPTATAQQVWHKGQLEVSINSDYSQQAAWQIFFIQPSSIWSSQFTAVRRGWVMITIIIKYQISATYNHKGLFLTHTTYMFWMVGWWRGEALFIGVTQGPWLREGPSQTCFHVLYCWGGKALF